MIDPMDYYLWQEVFDPELKYECQNCGTLFGDESVTWNGEAKCHVATCPACRSQSVVGERTFAGVGLSALQAGRAKKTERTI